MAILVVDDDPDICAALRMLLEERGATVVTARSGREARAALQGWNPDILVSDIRLPEEDGYALVRHIRAVDRFRTLPAVAVTAYEEEQERVAAAGFQACLGKPISPGELVSSLASLVRPAPLN